MRSSRLDSSVPRGPGRHASGAMPGADGPVAFRYLPPVLATFGAAVLLILVFGLISAVLVEVLLAFVAPAPDTPPPSILATGGCGLLTLAFLGATIYFVFAAFVAGRDLPARPVTHTGVVRLKHSGRGGARWVVVGPPESAEAAAARPVLAPAATPPAAGRTGARGFVRAGGSFASQMRDARVAPAAPRADEPLPLPEPVHRLREGEVNLRIDKHMFEALATGDRVEVVCSPHLQHVYYIRKHTPDGAIVLRNTALI